MPCRAPPPLEPSCSPATLGAPSPRRCASRHRCSTSCSRWCSPCSSGAGSTHRAIEAVWRIESAKLIAALARITRDVGLAEELAQDALVAALEQWPESGIPDKPGAWLMATAKHRAIDQLRHRKMQQLKH